MRLKLGEFWEDGWEHAGIIEEGEGGHPQAQWSQGQGFGKRTTEEPVTPREIHSFLGGGCGGFADARGLDGKGSGIGGDGTSGQNREVRLGSRPGGVTWDQGVLRGMTDWTGMKA